MSKGLSVVYTPEAECRINVDIIFVHGIAGDGFRTWKETGEGGSSCFWPHDLLPRIMPIDLHPRIMTFEYSGVILQSQSGNKKFIHDFSAELLRCTGEKRNEDQERKRPVVFISHSMGGFVLTECLVLTESRGGQNGGVGR
ncbi:hypothetical protein DL98DRAFT_593614 [Cadophora sp. DSE1049]|nr:hypothetical protein DL98DRAFT_593614 [Cadophora sp. DSE1049]